MLLAELIDRCANRSTGIVKEYIEAAEGLIGSRDRRGDIGFLSYITLEINRSIAEGVGVVGGGSNIRFPFVPEPL